jgi:AcrR family transcriptional regulator
VPAPPVKAGRSTRSRLSESQIVAVAARLLDRSGVERFTMSSLGEALDVTPMAVYRYFDDRQAIIQAAVERVLAELAASRPDGEPVAEVTSWMRCVRAQMLAHPWVPMLLGDEQRLSQAWVNVLDWLLSALQRCGLTSADSGRELVRISRTTLGVVIQELRVPLSATPAQTRDVTARRPHWAAVAPTLREYADDQLFDDLVADTVQRLRHSISPQRPEGVS